VDDGEEEESSGTAPKGLVEIFPSRAMLDALFAGEQTDSARVLPASIAGEQLKGFALSPSKRLRVRVKLSVAEASPPTVSAVLAAAGSAVPVPIDRGLADIRSVLVLSDANFLILDEPTSHLDMPALGAVERALAAYEGPLLLVSHDRYFIERVGVTRVMVLHDGALHEVESVEAYESELSPTSTL